MDKLKTNSKVKTTEVLAESKFFTEKDMIPTEVPMMNVALAGSVDGGLAPGLTVLAGPSKHFKTSFALIMASAYLKKYKMQFFYFTIQSLVHLNNILRCMILIQVVYFIHQSRMLKNLSLILFLKWKD